MSECERALSRFFSFVSTVSHLAHTHRGSSHESCVCHPCHPHVHEVSVSLRPCSHLFTSRTSFHLFLHLKLVDNLLRTPHKESMDLSDESYSDTGYEPNAYDFKETAVEPYIELLDSPPLFSDKGFPADAEYDDAALEGMLREAHRVHSHHSQREDLSVSLSSSSVSDRTGATCWGQSGATC